MYVHSKPKSADFLISERITINIALKALMDSRQKKQNHLLKPKSDLKKDKSTTSLCRERDKVNLKTNQKMTEMLGFKNKDTFYHALQVCKKDIPSLVNSLNYKKIAFLDAAKTSNLSANKQLKFIRTEQMYLNEISERNRQHQIIKHKAQNVLLLPDKNSTSLCPRLDEVKSSKNKKIANLMKFNSKSTDHHAKQVFSQRSLSLINLIDQWIISINTAFKISKSLPNEQNACIEKNRVTSQFKNNVHSMKGAR